MPDLARRFLTHENASIEVFGRMGTLYGTMKNLSQSGCYLELVKGAFSPKEGDFVQISLSLKSIAKTRNLTGQVVWNKGLGFGVEFIKKEDVAKKMLSKFQVM